MKLFVLKARYDDDWYFKKIREYAYHTKVDYMTLYIGLIFRAVR